MEGGSSPSMHALERMHACIPQHGLSPRVDEGVQLHPSVALDSGLVAVGSPSMSASRVLAARMNLRNLQDALDRLLGREAHHGPSKRRCGGGPSDAPAGRAGKAPPTPPPAGPFLTK